MMKDKPILHTKPAGPQVEMPLAEPPPATPAPTAAAPKAATPAPTPFGWTCAKCRYVAAMSDGTYQCRHEPPTYSANGPNITVSAWPPVAASDWCGVYAPSP